MNTFRVPAPAGRQSQERRTLETERKSVLPVRLTRKLAEVIDGVDLADRSVGDRLALEPDKAKLLLAEGWAVLVPPAERRREDFPAT